MYRVIDTIARREAWLRHYPDLPQTEGLLVILDPMQIRAPLEPIQAVRVQRPDGTSTVMTVSEVVVGAGNVVGLFFLDAEQNEVPRNSVIEIIGRIPTPG